MKTLTVRLPDALAARITEESRDRGISKSDVVRERLEGGAGDTVRPRSLAAIADLVGAVDGLPPDLSGKRKARLKATGYGRKHPR